MIDALRDERITTWFDLGLMLDRLRDGRGTPSLNFDDDFDAFARHISRGVGLVTFYGSVDGVTVEIAKYAEAMRHVTAGAATPPDHGSFRCSRGTDHGSQGRAPRVARN